MRALLVALVLMCWPMQARAEPLTVFAAASLKNVFDTVAQLYTQETGQEVIVSYAGTSVLARQIEQGAPVDVFASASDAWTLYLAERDLLVPGMTDAFAGNTLVLIASHPLELEGPLDLSSPEALLDLLGPNGRVAVALVDAVPAGQYARDAMQHLGVWDALQPRLAQADNVRAALRLVALGEAPLGIVYASDARADPSVSVVATFPASSHAPIRYTASLVGKSPDPQAEAFLQLLKDPTIQFLFFGEGFVPLHPQEGG